MPLMDINNNKVINFIDEVDKEKSAIQKQNAYMSSPIYKKGQMETCKKQAKDECLQYIFADLYKNALPLDDSYINCNDEKLCNDMKDFINRQTANRGVDCYVREGIKRGNTALKQVMEAVDAFVEACYREKAEKIDKIDVKDLDFKLDEDKKKKLREISNDASLKEVANYVKKNVKAAAEYEKGKIIEKRERAKEIQDELEKNNEISTEAVLETYMSFHGLSPIEKTVYQPSLFEGVMIAAFDQIDMVAEATEEDAFSNAICEYTMLNIDKALKIHDYKLESVRKLAKEYAAGNIMTEAKISNASIALVKKTYIRQYIRVAASVPYYEALEKKIPDKESEKISSEDIQKAKKGVRTCISVMKDIRRTMDINENDLSQKDRQAIKSNTEKWIKKLDNMSDERIVKECLKIEKQARSFEKQMDMLSKQVDDFFGPAGAGKSMLDQMDQIAQQEMMRQQNDDNIRMQNQLIYNQQQMQNHMNFANSVAMGMPGMF